MVFPVRVCMWLFRLNGKASQSNDTDDETPIARHARRAALVT